RTQTQRVEGRRRVMDVGVRVGGGCEAEWVTAVVAAGRGVVVAVVVVVVAGFGGVVLAGEPEWAVWPVGPGLDDVAPQVGSLLPSHVSVGGDEFGGCAGEVGDDGVEPAVDLVLVDLSDRGEGAGCVLPGRCAGTGDLFGELCAVPDEVDPFGGRVAVGVLALLGDASAEWVVGVAPA